MNEDLKIIKRKYGEKMAHLCREIFPGLLETKGLLPNLLLRSFEPSHDLYQDIVSNNLVDAFKNFIYKQVDVENNNQLLVTKRPEELLSEAGYDLYECKSEKDIQSFRKYYQKGEELCTFNGGRLKHCHVFFAVKRDVDRIRRKDFKNPTRQDLYGTSVISIQFDRDPSHRLSIKNRYNHTVNSPDATFSNNLDNITPGLTDSFEKYYGLKQKFKSDGFEIPDYVLANDGKFYKYNYEIKGINYCSNNVIIDHGEIKRFDREKYIIFDYFILELDSNNRSISLYDKSLNDSLPESIGDIRDAKIEILRHDDEKEIIITKKDGSEIFMTLNKDNCLIKYKDDFVEKIDDDFLLYNKYLKEISLASASVIGNYFLFCDGSLEKINMPSAIKIGYSFLFKGGNLISLSLPKVREIGELALYKNATLQVLDLPECTEIGYRILYFNKNNIKLYAPKLVIRNTSIKR